MADTYFMFKTLRIQNIGGIMPQNVNILGSTGEWYWGKVSNANILWDIREFFPMPITQQVADGLTLLNVTQLPIDPSDPDSALRDLTVDELAAKTEAQKILKKLNIRFRIESEIGDAYDLIADLSKRISLIERPAIKILNELMTDGVISQASKDAYGPLMAEYVNGINLGTIVDRTDLELNTEVFARLTERFTKIHNIVKEEYSL